MALLGSDFCDRVAKAGERISFDDFIGLRLCMLAISVGCYLLHRALMRDFCHFVAIHRVLKHFLEFLVEARITGDRPRLDDI